MTEAIADVHKIAQRPPVQIGGRFSSTEKMP